ncbi:hypothetical protein CEUSTIGMA_g2385.t1 [Chlamydomonas eustigma]|uniref:SHSP domain-containing protein n=1 Tax=Chlamydomonas eustigma TaxID=1157962 RepID=A0A250WW54_9CHLO|nr:hypothetical protein CEUSTIGMA_g2385.t1 [Chlamydomonas eustigma]|eukprot:GAX74939.1 hypothetical protein CEUSTIGMA_g2385.t1 [Chlamydomonas eustigma]
MALVTHPFSLLDPFVALEHDPFFHYRPSGAVTGIRSPALEYPMDIKETDAGYELVADAPGMKPEEISVEFNEASRVLTVRGQHSEETKSGRQPSQPSAAVQGKVKHMYRCERSVKRSFLRSFTVPKDVDPEGISAQLEYGVLNVHIPKKEAVPKPASRKIPITTTSNTESGPASSIVQTKLTSNGAAAVAAEEDQPMK